MYSHLMDHLTDELKRLDRLLYLHILRQEEGPHPQMDSLKGLVLSEEEVMGLFRDQPPLDGRAETRELLRDIDDLERMIAENLDRASKAGKVFPFTYLCKLFSLGRFEAQCILLCLAPHLDRKYEKLYAYIQDDVTCKYPSVDLAMKLFCRTQEERNAARFLLLNRLDPYLLRLEYREHTADTLPARELKLNERLIPFLLGTSRVHTNLSFHMERFRPDDPLPEVVGRKKFYERFASFCSPLFSGDPSGPVPDAVFLCGAGGVGKKLMVRTVCSRFRYPLLLVDLESVIGERKEFEERLIHIFGESRLQQAALAFDRFHILLERGDSSSSSMIRSLWERIRQHPGPVFVLSEQKWSAPDRGGLFSISVEGPDESERKRLWEHFASAFSFSDDMDWADLGGRFRLTPGQIRDALKTAKSLAAWEDATDGTIGEKHLARACHLQSRHRLEQKAKKIRPLFTWDDLILPDDAKAQLEQACNQVRHRHRVYGEWGFEKKLSYGKGLSLLFYGPPGTGKTMSAEVIANELQLELYKVDLAQVVSKYIGETEKNLHEIFDEAYKSNAILFFDEMDALFGKRSEVKDSHDKYANMEVAFLLQKMEEYEGITILSTNFMQNIDEAFIRRIRFIIKFPFPDASYRERIWRSVFPEDAPLDQSVDFPYLARTFEITGSHIKNIAVSAAFLAAGEDTAIGMKHLIRAARQELTKSGKIVTKADLGEYEEFF